MQALHSPLSPAAVVVVGGRARQSAAGIQRSSAVAEGVRRHSRRPVLFIADEHPLLCRTLSAIAEETDEADEVSDEEQELCSQVRRVPVWLRGDRAGSPPAVLLQSCEACFLHWRVRCR